MKREDKKRLELAIKQSKADLVRFECSVELKKMRIDELEKEFLSFEPKQKEPVQPTIIKSGDIWVAEFDGVDYLMVIPYKLKIEMENKFSFESGIKMGIWKPISEIELTDDIAKLRPMVTCETFKSPLKLYGIDDNNILIIERDTQRLKKHIRLATVKDLRS